jgi:hypothetical protein
LRPRPLGVHSDRPAFALVAPLRESLFSYPVHPVNPVKTLFASSAPFCSNPILFFAPLRESLFSYPVHPVNPVSKSVLKPSLVFNSAF